MQRVGVLLCWALLGLLVLSVNAPTLDYGIAYDDVTYLVERDAAWDQGWLEFFSNRQWGVGRHAALLSLDLNRTPTLSPRPFHQTNVAIAVLAVVLLFELARALGLATAGALAAAALFSVHPLHTDAVVSIIGRATSMAGCAVLACLLLHVRGRDTTRWGLTATGAIAFLGLCSKESAIVLLPLTLAYDALLRPADRPFARKPYVAIVVAVGIWAALNFSNFASVSPVAYIDNPLAYVDPMQRVLRACELLWSYAALSVWPVGLLPDRSYAITGPELVAGPMGILAWIGVLVGTWLLRARTPRLVFFVLWFPIAFAATANVAFPIGTIMAERLAFLPSAAPCLLVGLGVSALVRRGRTIALATALGIIVIVFVLALVYDDRGRIWASDEHYHEMTATLCPRSAKAHYNLGLARARAGDSDGAAVAFTHSIEIYPAFSRAVYYLASIHKETGHLKKAAAVWRAYLADAPDDLGAQSQIISVLLALGAPQEALVHAREMQRLAPQNEAYRRQLSVIEERVRRARADQSLKDSSRTGSR